MPDPRRCRPTAILAALAVGLITACSATSPGADPAPTGGSAATSVPIPTPSTTTPPSRPTTTDAPDPTGPDPGRRPAPTDLQGPLVPRIVAQHPHDRQAWTQGLEWYGGVLVESTGRVGASSIRLVEPTTGTVLDVIDIAEPLYAEGATVVDDQVIQLTWTNGTLLRTALDPRAGPRFVGPVEVEPDAYDGEGWGLCDDGRHLVMTDGSATVVRRDRSTFDVVEEMTVTLDGVPVTRLNELECAGDQIWANIWQTTTIVAFDATTGEVEATVDAGELVPDGSYTGNEVLNGIAIHPDTGRFWLTGKHWPVMYEVELVADR